MLPESAGFALVVDDREKAAGWTPSLTRVSRPGRPSGKQKDHPYPPLYSFRLLCNRVFHDKLLLAAVFRGFLNTHSVTVVIATYRTTSKLVMYGRTGNCINIDSFMVLFHVCRINTCLDRGSSNPTMF